MLVSVLESVSYFLSVAGCWDFPFLAFYGEEGSSVMVKYYHLKQGDPVLNLETVMCAASSEIPARGSVKGLSGILLSLKTEL